MSEWADRRPVCNPRTNDEAEVIDRHAVAERRIADSDVGLDLTRGPDPGLTLDDDARVNDGICPNLDIRLDVGGGRIDERDARRHQFLVLFLSQEAAHFRKFRAAVNSPDF